MRILAVSALALMAAATPAFAQDAGDDTQAPRFNGPYIALSGGFDQVGIEEQPAANGDPAVPGQSKDGVNGVVQLGYDARFGNFVAGVEGEAGLANTKLCEYDVDVAGDSLCVKAGRDLYAGARLGYVLDNKTMFYLKGGYTNAAAKLVYDDGTDSETLETEELDGVRAGAGVETYVTDHFTLRSELRYSNYEHDIERWQVTFGAGFRF